MQVQMLVAHWGRLLADGVGRDQAPLATVSSPMTDGDPQLQAHKRHVDAKMNPNPVSEVPEKAGLT